MRTNTAFFNIHIINLPAAGEGGAETAADPTPGPATGRARVSALRRELAGCFDLTVWLSCPREKRVARLAGRGDTPPEEIEYWLPSEDAYVAAHAPRQRAHLVVDASADAAAGAGLVTKRWSPPPAAGYRMRES